MLEIKDLHVSVEGEKILKGVNLKINEGEITTVMGPNGSGKTSLAFAIMGHPKYEITKGKILFKGKDITNLSPDKRAKLGLFLSFQYPSEVSGVTVSNFLRTALKASKGKELNLVEFKELLDEKMELLKIDKNFSKRYLNEGFSGGEKKRMEILQLAVLEPSFAVIDEVDSGLDIDSLKIVAENLKELHEKLNMGILLITHYDRILKYITTDKVVILKDGKVDKTGGKELASHIEEKGYD